MMNIEMNNIPLLGVKRKVLFPGSVIRLTIGRPNSVRLVENLWDAANRTYKKGAIVAICTIALSQEEVTEELKKGNANPSKADDVPPSSNNHLVEQLQKVQISDDQEIYTIGTLAKVIQLSRINSADNQSYQFSILLEGTVRIRVASILRKEPYVTTKLFAESETESNHAQDSSEARALALNIKQSTRELLDLVRERGASSSANEKQKAVTEAIERANPSRLADILSSNMEASVLEKQFILAEPDLVQRLRRALELVNRQLEVLKMSKKIQSQVEGKLKNTQREYYLRQQMKAIQDELSTLTGKGPGPDEAGELEQLEAAITKANLPPEVRASATRELTRMRGMQPSQPEYTVIRTYLDWIAELPWGIYTTDNLDVHHARKQLDDDHYSLDKVKRRMVEFLAVRSLKADSPGPILCLYGPPGVGKTSLGRSIATSLGRKFRRIALGGVRDEAEIRGHRRTYIGALPGNIIHAMKKAGTANPVILLDEIDKLGRDARGDPASALLEVLDPEQNGTFTDHYLNVPFDLSKVMFICTANDISQIPAPLLDRMELIEVNGYALHEKAEIALRHLIPKQMERHGITSEHLDFNLKSVEHIIQGYTREAGVRTLDREIASVCRIVAVQVAEARDRHLATVKKNTPINSVIVETSDEGTPGVIDSKSENHESSTTPKQPLLLEGFTKVVLTPAMVEEILGPVKYESEVASRSSIPGVSTGLAWTQVGGEILFIEASLSRGNGRITLTGRMGQVMEESVKAALSYVRANLGELGLYDQEDIFGDLVDGLKRADLHIHIPSGGVPKDGPSAGVAITAAIVSALSGRPVRSDTACTGEITLRGLVLPVGGIREKVLAAHRAGIRRVVLPSRNRGSASEIPENVRKDLEIIFVSNILEAMGALFDGVQNDNVKALPLWRIEQKRESSSKSSSSSSSSSSSQLLSLEENDVSSLHPKRRESSTGNHGSAALHGRHQSSLKNSQVVEEDIVGDFYRSKM